jgi:hypothetical protein
MRQELLVGAAGLLLSLGALGAKAETAPSSDALQPKLIDVQMTDGRASDDSAMFGRLIDNFGPNHQFGAPASPSDFSGIESRLER